MERTIMKSNYLITLLLSSAQLLAMQNPMMPQATAGQPNNNGQTMPNSVMPVGAPGPFERPNTQATPLTFHQDMPIPPVPGASINPMNHSMGEPMDEIPSMNATDHPMNEPMMDENRSMPSMDHSMMPAPSMNSMDEPMMDDHEAIPTMMEPSRMDPFDSEQPFGQEREEGRMGTAERDRFVPNLSITQGSSHDLDSLRDSNERYMIQSPEHRSFLEHEEVGPDRPHSYKVHIADDARPGRFTVFKTRGSGANPTKLIPAFHVEIKAAPTALPTQNIKAMIKQAWDQQEKAEQTFFVTMKTQFEFFTQQIRDIWFNVSLANDNFEENGKQVLEKPLHMHVNEKKLLIKSTGGSISSSNPTIVKAEMTSLNHSEQKGSHETPSWEFSIFAEKVGSARVTYCVNGTTHVQPVIVQHELLQEHSKSESRLSDRQHSIHHEPISNHHKDEAMMHEARSSHHDEMMDRHDMNNHDREKSSFGSRTRLTPGSENHDNSGNAFESENHSRDQHAEPVFGSYNQEQTMHDEDIADHNDLPPLNRMNHEDEDRFEGTEHSDDIEK